jgi:hypothetical protein
VTQQQVRVTNLPGPAASDDEEEPAVSAAFATRLTIFRETSSVQLFFSLPRPENTFDLDFATS